MNTSIVTNPVNNYTAWHSSFRFVAMKLSFDEDNVTSTFYRVGFAFFFFFSLEIF